VKYKAELIKPVVKPYADIAEQGDEYGTAKAVEAAIPSLNADIDTVMVVQWGRQYVL